MQGPTYWNTNNTLCIEQCAISELVKEYGTPLNVMSESQLMGNLSRFQTAFSKGWDCGDARILPAIKANTRLEICKKIAQKTKACDLFSEGELYAAMQAGFDPKLMSLNGNSKITSDMKFLRYAIENDVRLTLDDAAEFPPIEEIAKSLNKKVRLRVRMRLELPELLTRSTDFSSELIPTEIAMAIYKPGIPNEDLIPLGKKLIESQWIEFSGVHIHTGRHHQDVGFWQVIMTGLARQLLLLKEQWDGWEPKEIDIGGGFAQELDPVAKSLNRARFFEMATMTFIQKCLKPFPKLRNKVTSSALKSSYESALDGEHCEININNGPSIEEYAQVITHTLRKEMKARGLTTQGVILEVEPGRALYGTAGLHISRVIHKKRQTKPYPVAWVVADTTESFFGSIALEHAIYPYVVDGKPLSNYAKDKRMVADLVGKSCNADRIIPNACFPSDIAVGDIIIQHYTGAYEENSSRNFNSMPRPATVLVNGDQSTLIRRRETIEDVFSRDILSNENEKIRSAV